MRRPGQARRHACSSHGTAAAPAQAPRLAWLRPALAVAAPWCIASRAAPASPGCRTDLVLERASGTPPRTARAAPAAAGAGAHPERAAAPATRAVRSTRTAVAGRRRRASLLGAPKAQATPTRTGATDFADPDRHADADADRQHRPRRRRLAANGHRRRPARSRCGSSGIHDGGDLAPAGCRSASPSPELVAAGQAPSPASRAAPGVRPSGRTRLSMTAAATSPAEEVRSTVGPSRAATAPAPASAAVSAGLTPPSGPTITTMIAAARAAARCSARRRRPDRAAPPARPPATRPVDVRRGRQAGHLGDQARRDCLAASRAVARQRASALLRPVAAPAGHAALGRPGHDHVHARPRSSAPPPARRDRPWGSPAPPRPGARRAARCAGPGRPAPARPAGPRSPRTRRPAPAPSVTSTRSPGASRRTVAACRPSAADPSTASRRSQRWRRRRCSPARTDRRSPGRVPPRQRPLKASRSREKNPCWPGREPAGRRLLAAELGQLPEQLLLLGVELGRRLHGHVDDQVAAAGGVQVRDALAVQRDGLAGLGARAGCPCRPGRPGSPPSASRRAPPPPSGSSPCSAGRHPGARRSRAAAGRSPGTGPRAGRRPGRSRPRRPAGCASRPRPRPGSGP